MQSQPGKTDEGCAIARRDSVCSAPWPQSLCPDCSCGRSLERTAFTLTLSLFSGRGSWKFLWLLAGTLHPVFFVAPFVPSSEILLPLAQPQTLGPGRASPLMAACLSNGQQEPSGLLPGAGSSSPCGVVTSRGARGSCARLTFAGSARSGAALCLRPADILGSYVRFTFDFSPRRCESNSAPSMFDLKTAGSV